MAIMTTNKFLKKNLSSWILMWLITMSLLVEVLAYAATKEAAKTETIKVVGVTSCNDVDIKEIRSLQFGLLRVKAGSGGWAIVSPLIWCCTSDITT
jgi:hypothetical protein